jgi:MATE family multidrug resistance protein
MSISINKTKGLFIRLLTRGSMQTATGLIIPAGFFLGAMMLSKLGEKTFAAAALIFAVQAFIQSMITMPLNVIGGIISRNFGAKDDVNVGIQRCKEIGKILRSGQCLSLCLALPAIVVAFFIGDLLKLTGQQPQLCEIVQSYFTASVWGIPATVLLFCSQQFANGINKQWTALSQGIIGLGILLLFSYPTIFGKWGFPALGAAGLGYAVALRSWINLFMLEGRFFFDKTTQPFNLFILDSLKKPTLYMKKIWQIGWPISVQYGIELSSMIVTTIMAGNLGQQALVVRGLSAQYSMLLIIPLIAFSQACTVLVGQARGQIKYDDASKLSYMAIGTGVVFALMFMGIFFAAFKPMVNLFIVIDWNNKSLVSLIVVVMSLTLGGLVIDTARNVSTGALRAFDDTKFPALMGALGLLIVKIPLSWVLAFPVGMGLVGLALAHVIGLVIGTLPVLERWRKCINKQCVHLTTISPANIINSK